MADRTLARAALRLNARNGYAGRLPALVLMTDDERVADPLAAARTLPRGSVVMLRARDGSRRARLAVSLATLARQHDLILLIAGDPDLAARCGADGVHFPEARIGEAAHWRARRGIWFITCAAHSLAACARVRFASADAVFLAPVFSTGSHPGRAGLGHLRARAIARASTVAVYALGGIDAQSARRLEGGRFAGIAAVGALAGPGR